MRSFPPPPALLSKFIHSLPASQQRELGGWTCLRKGCIVSGVIKISPRLFLLFALQDLLLRSLLSDIYGGLFFSEPIKAFTGKSKTSQGIFLSVCGCSQLRAVGVTSLAPGARCYWLWESHSTFCVCVYVITSQISFLLAPFLLEDSALVGMSQVQSVNQEIRGAFS